MFKLYGAPLMLRARSVFCAAPTERTLLVWFFCFNTDWFSYLNVGGFQ